MQLLPDQINLLDLDSETVLKHLAQTGPKRAFYICDIGDVVKKQLAWVKALPRVHPHYAVKCNATLSVLKTLASLGVGFDCASEQEIRQILSLNVNPDRIIFANPTKFPSHITYAASVGVTTMTFDSLCELHKIKSLCPHAETLIRIRCDDPLARYKLGKKFGCDPIDETVDLLELARDLKVKVVGVCFHIGSSSQNFSTFRDAIESASKVFKIGKQFGFNFTVLDIGGGFMGERGTSIDEPAKIINMALEEFFPDKSVRVISEPGRYFVTSAFTLAANIHTVKSKIVDGEIEKHYYIDDGVYGSFIAVLIDEVLPARAIEKIDGAEVYRSTIWGPTCDSTDRVQENALLPKLDVGDWLIFDNMGAYTLSIYTNFNGYSCPKVYSIVDETTWKLLIMNNELGHNDFNPNHKNNTCLNFSRIVENELLSKKNKVGKF